MARVVRLTPGYLRTFRQLQLERARPALAAIVKSLSQDDLPGYGDFEALIPPQLRAWVRRVPFFNPLAVPFVGRRGSPGAHDRGVAASAGRRVSTPSARSCELCPEIEREIYEALTEVELRAVKARHHIHEG